MAASMPCQKTEYPLGCANSSSISRPRLYSRTPTSRELQPREKLALVRQLFSRVQVRRRELQGGPVQALLMAANPSAREEIRRSPVGLVVGVRRTRAILSTRLTVRPTGPPSGFACPTIQSSSISRSLTVRVTVVG